MKNLFKTLAPFLISLAIIAAVFLVAVQRSSAASIVPAFPGALNYFTEGEVIEEEDWNAIEIRLGENGTTSRSTLTFQVNDLMATTSMLHVTTLAGLTTTGALNAGSVTSGFGSIDLGADAFTTTGLGTFGTLLANGSSTLQAFTAASGTIATLLSSKATTTDLFVSNLASTTEIRANTGFIGYLTSVFGNFVDATFSGHASSTGNVFAGGNLNFNGELLPDGLTCSNGQVLKKTGTNDWDCATDDTGASLPWAFTKQADNSQATTTLMNFIGGFEASASSTVNALFNALNVQVTGSSTLQAFTGTNYLALASTTLQNFTGQNASTTNFNVSANEISLTSSNLVLNASTTAAFRVASSTLDVAGNSYNRSTTTLHLANYPERRKVVSVSCMATSTGGVIFHIGDGTNFSTGVFCDNLRKQTVINYTLDPFEDFVVMLGKASTTPGSVTISATMNKLSN